MVTNRILASMVLRLRINLVITLWLTLIIETLVSVVPACTTRSFTTLGD